MKLAPLLLAVAPLVACSSQAAQPSSSSGLACEKTDALWLSSDYSSSAVGALALDGTVTYTVGKADLGADPALATSRGRAFLVARDEDLVFELDPHCGTPIQSWNLDQASGAGSLDPYDVAVANDGSMWVALYDVPLLLVLTPGGDVARTIDLSSYDGDGNPQASAVNIVDTPAGEKAFIVLERLDDAAFPQSNQPSWMLRVDVATGAVEGHVQLAGRNPFSVFADGATLWLAEPGNFYDATEADAGIERFDTATSTSTLVVRETDLGGSVSEVAVSGGCGAAVVADPTTANATSLVTFDPSVGMPLRPASQAPLATPGFDLEGLAWTGGTLLLGDRRRAASGYPVHAFDVAGSCSLVARPDAVFVPLPPVAVRALL